MTSWLIISINALALVLILALIYSMAGLKTDMEDIRELLEKNADERSPGQ